MRLLIVALLVGGVARADQASLSQATSLEKSGKLVEAARLLDKLLHKELPERERREARERLDALERQLARLIVVTVPEAADVSVDGERLGLTPTETLWLKAGAHRVEMRKTGFLSLEAQVNVPPGGAQKLEQSLSADAAASTGGNRERKWLWAGLGAAGAVAVVAIVVGVGASFSRPAPFSATLDPLDRQR